VLGEIDHALLEQLGASDTTAGIKPKKAAAAAPQGDVKAETISAIIASAEDVKPDPMILKIQAGLKAFGNDGMEIDGVIGSKNRAGIKRIQSLVGPAVAGAAGGEI